MFSVSIEQSGDPVSRSRGARAQGAKAGFFQRASSRGASGPERAGGEAAKVVSLPASLIEVDKDVWPENRNEVPLWRIKAETRAAILDVKLPPYRTLAEFAVDCAKCIAALSPKPTAAALALVPENCTGQAPSFPQGERLPNREAAACPVQPKPETVSLAETFETPPLPLGPFAQPRRPKLVPMKGDGVHEADPKVEAKLFLTWLIAEHLTGKWSSEEMTDFYGRFCAGNSRTPIPENVLRNALKHLPGAKKDILDNRKGGSGTRCAQWTIEGTPPMKQRKANVTRQERRAA